MFKLTKRNGDLAVECACFFSKDDVRFTELCSGRKNVVHLLQDVGLPGKRCLYPVCEKGVEFVVV